MKSGFKIYMSEQGFSFRRKIFSSPLSQYNEFVYTCIDETSQTNSESIFWRGFLVSSFMLFVGNMLDMVKPHVNSNDLPHHIHSLK